MKNTEETFTEGATRDYEISLMEGVLYKAFISGKFVPHKADEYLRELH